ncbi:MAG: 50S ribosomal protein L30 [Anaerolineales bacterium]|jgi:large subunit ribosomal protein L30|nr:50S ribosomal protein L30 [Anaerolineales bacterium]MDP7643703.1 50S ribosomal protein L30 [Anaerolineales bacterium]HJL69750.1 50S ribosomal protein L30 [Anaerolineales bacterium]HJN41894.1 50S ribosomal protein L30 [Anaerolineales bacterium]
MARKSKKKTVQITLVRSPLGTSGRHRGTVRALGLRRPRHTVQHVDTPQLRGMLAKVAHLVEIEEGR